MTRPRVRIREEQSLSGPPTKNLRGDPLHKLLNIMRVRGTNNIDISLIYTFEMKKNVLFEHISEHLQSKVLHDLLEIMVAPC